MIDVRRAERYVVALAVFLICSYYSARVFKGYPYSSDEYNHVYQAQMLASGRMSVDAPIALSPLFEQYTVWKNRKLFSKYPPGMPLLFAPLVRWSAHVFVNPLILALTVLILFHLLECYVAPPAARFTLLIIAANPYFLGYGCTLYSHPTALLLTALALLALARFKLQGGGRWLCTLGAAVGLLLLFRPLEAACVAAAAGGAALLHRPGLPRIRRLPFLFAPIMLGFAALLLWNYLLTQELRIAPHNVFFRDFQVRPVAGGGFWINARASITGWWDNMFRYLIPVIQERTLYLAAAPLALAALGACRGKIADVCVCAALIAMLVVAYGFHTGRGFPVFGSRYMYPCLAPLAVLAAIGLEPFCRFRRMAVAVLVVLAFQLNQATVSFAEQQQRLTRIWAVQADVEKRCPPNSIVILQPRWIGKFQRIFVLFPDLKRNPFLNGPRLLLLDEAAYPQVAAYYPERARCVYAPPNMPEAARPPESE